MKSSLAHLSALLAGAALLLTVTFAEARDYGVSRSSAGRGNVYTTERGGSAYVGPRGAAVQGADGRTAVDTRRGAAYSGPNATAVSGRYGAAAVTDNGAVVAGRTGAAAVGVNGAVVTTRPVVAPLPAGYIRTVPTGYTTVVYGGYNCLFVGGVYYRPVFYGGETVYVIVR